MMKVLGTSKFGRRHISFLDHPKPKAIGPTEVVIKILYSDLNPVDHHKLNAKPNGTPTPPHRTPYIVGFGGSGIVESVSPNADDETTRAFLNKNVCFIADPSKDGSYAEYIVCDVRLVAIIPDSSYDVDNSMASAACIPVAGCTALECMEKVGLKFVLPGNCDEVGGSGSSSSSSCKPTTTMKEGSRLLIVGGSGGVGSWITRLARAAYPELDIVCTAGSKESSEWCTKNGASTTIGHDEIEKKLGGGPKGSCDFILCLTEPTVALFASLSEVLRPFGKICLVVAGSDIKMLDLSFVFFKSGTVSTETVFSSIRCGYFLDQALEMSIILEALGRGALVAPLCDGWNENHSDWREANKEGGYIDMVGSGHMRGNMVMKMGGGDK